MAARPIPRRTIAASWRKRNGSHRTFPTGPSSVVSWLRACTNLGGLLAEQSRAAEAELILRRGIALNADLTAKQPGDVQVRLDLAKCRNNLGYLLLESGQTEGAIAELEQAQPEFGAGQAVSRYASLSSRSGR